MNPQNQILGTLFFPQLLLGGDALLILSMWLMWLNYNVANVLGGPLGVRTF